MSCTPTHTGSSGACDSRAGAGRDDDIGEEKGEGESTKSRTHGGPQSPHHIRYLIAMLVSLLAVMLL